MSSDDHLSTDSSGDSVPGSRRRPVKHVLVTVGVIAVLGALAGAGVLYSGLFNVAATVTDAAPLRWMFVTVREGSIKYHARDIPAPPDADAAHLANGFMVYREDCVMCHTPAGRQPSPMALGLNPQAPSFAENDMTAAQLFWVAKNGIRFTGMPAWGASRSDQDLWDAVDFAMTLPKMSPSDYDAMDRRMPLRQQATSLAMVAGQGPAALSASSPSAHPHSP